MSVTTPPLGIVFSYLALLENRKCIKELIVKWSPDTEKIIPALIERYSTPGTVISLILSSITTIISLIFLVMHLQIRETDNYVNYILIQAALTGFLVIGVSGIAWVLFSLNSIFESLLAKVWLSLAVSAGVIFSRLNAVEFFSTNFPFPPSYMPFAFSLATLIFTFSFSAFVLAALAVAFEFMFIVFLLIFDFKNKRMLTGLLFAISFGGFLGSYSAALAMIQGITNKGQLFMIKAAERYDFTQHHMCQVEKHETVLFIENVSDRAIAATFPAPLKGNKISLQNISGDTLASYRPTHFHTVPCNPISVSRKDVGWCGTAQRYGFCKTAPELPK